MPSIKVPVNLYTDGHGDQVLACPRMKAASMQFLGCFFSSNGGFHMSSLSIG